MLDLGKAGRIGEVATAKSMYKIASVVLTLSGEEAEVLHAILRSVGGSATMTRRGLADAILAALAKANVRGNDDDLSGNIIFEGKA